MSIKLNGATSGSIDLLSNGKGTKRPKLHIW